jgi:hypothetical protein
VLWLLVAFLPIGAVEQQPKVPIWDGSLPPAGSVRGNICNLAVVKGLRSSGLLQVRAGPGTRYRVMDALANGERVYTCNEHEEWLGVAYRRPGAPCGTREGVGLDVMLTRPCRSG